jgi:Transposase, Mutator family
MYARGMTVREIQGHLLDLYGLEVSPDLVSTITDAVLETVDQRGLPRDDRADLHRASYSQFHGFCIMEGPQSHRRRVEDGLSGERDADAGRQALDEFDGGPWGRKYPATAQSWRRHWEQVIPFFAFPVAVRRIIYTTDEIDKHFVFSCAIFFLARATSWPSAGSSARPPDHSRLAVLMRPRTAPPVVWVAIDQRSVHRRTQPFRRLFSLGLSAF